MKVRSWVTIGFCILILFVAVETVILPNIPQTEARKGVFSVKVDRLSPEDASKALSVVEYGDWLSGNHFVKVEYGAAAVIYRVGGWIPLRFCNGKGVNAVNGVITAYYEYDAGAMIGTSILVFLLSIFLGICMGFRTSHRKIEQNLLLSRKGNFAVFFILSFL